MLVYGILLVLGAVMLCVYIREKLRGYTVRETVVKSVVSMLFIAVALNGWYVSAVSAAGDPSARGVHAMAAFVLPGLVMGLLGDIWLDLKFVFPDQSDAFTYAGISAFGVGHILYFAGLLMRYYPTGQPLYVIVPIVLGILVSLFAVGMEKPMKLHYGKIKALIFVYGALLFSVVALAGALAIRSGWTETPLTLFFIGGILFAASDLVLSGTYFGVGKDRPIDIILNYGTYYPAQFLIASSLLFLA